MDKNFISKAFLILLIVTVVYACYRIFAPFLDEILVAAILVTIFHRPYRMILKRLGNRKTLASLLMCILIALLVILPLANIIVYAAQRSGAGYERTLAFINENKLDGLLSGGYLDKLNTFGLGADTIRGAIVDMAQKVNDWLVSGATNFISGAANFLISLLLILFTMFFFFMDGQKMVEKVMYWTPLPNKYDREIFKKFHDVSFSIMLSVFSTAFAQGIVGAIGFLIVGLPALYGGIAMGLFALIPYVGTTIIWVPAVIYLFVTGQVWQAIFLLIWALAVISTIDNVMKALLIKGKAKVHPIFVFFSILGGISLFGFWGVIFGPLIISLAITVLHIYELEYESVLEK